MKLYIEPTASERAAFMHLMGVNGFSDSDASIAWDMANSAARQAMEAYQRVIEMTPHHLQFLAGAAGVGLLNRCTEQGVASALRVSREMGI